MRSDPPITMKYENYDSAYLGTFGYTLSFYHDPVPLTKFVYSSINSSSNESIFLALSQTFIGMLRKTVELCHKKGQRQQHSGYISTKVNVHRLRFV